MKIGIKVTVVVMEQIQFTGTLDAWGETGLLIRLELSGQSLFFPWHSILYIMAV